MGIPEELEELITRWDRLSRWEKSEVGRALRRLGMSYGEIGQVIDVKKSTLATWCRQIELTEEQARAIQQRTGSRAGIPVDTQWRRRREIEIIRTEARAEAQMLLLDPFWVAGVVLYWAEGSKTRNQLRLSNSDPQALRLFITWVRRYLEADADFVLQLHLHEGNDELAARLYWKEATDLPEARFHKTFVKPSGTGHRKNHLEHGVCRITVCGAGNHWNKVMTWVGYVSDSVSRLKSGERPLLSSMRASSSIGRAAGS